MCADQVQRTTNYDFVSSIDPTGMGSGGVDVSDFGGDVSSDSVIATNRGLLRVSKVKSDGDWVNQKVRGKDEKLVDDPDAQRRLANQMQYRQLEQFKQNKFDAAAAKGGDAAPAFRHFKFGFLSAGEAKGMYYSRRKRRDPRAPAGSNSDLFPLTRAFHHPDYKKRLMPAGLGYGQKHPDFFAYQACTGPPRNTARQNFFAEGRVAPETKKLDNIFCKPQARSTADDSQYEQELTRSLSPMERVVRSKEYQETYRKYKSQLASGLGYGDKHRNYFAYLQDTTDYRNPKGKGNIK